jgi:WD40 repeat protein
MTSLNSKKERNNPFPGLRPFTTGECDLFFGREWESREILELLLKNRSVTVTGPSGSGKSSLINCGLLPGIKDLSAAGSEKWRIVTFRPGIDPIGNMADAFISASGEQGDVDRKSVIEQLRGNCRAVAEVCKELITLSDEKLLIVVDQFEDILRYRALATGENFSADMSCFISLLVNAVNRDTADIFLVIGIRSAYLSGWTGYPELAKLINKGIFLVHPVRKESLPDVIEKPVQLSGAAIDPELTRTLINDIAEFNGNLLVLQQTLMMTWASWKEVDEPDRPLGLSDYNFAGTAIYAISKTAGKIYGELNPLEKKNCELLFRLITGRGNDNRPVTNPLNINTIKERLDCSGELLNDLTGKFSQQPFPVILLPAGQKGDNDYIVDLRDANLIYLWSMLGKWVEDEDASAKMYLRLSEESALYQQGKAGLMKQPGLQLALEWRNRFNPSLNWALRYDPAWERAMVYLRTSEKVYLQEEEAKVILRKKKFRKAGIISAILGGILAIVTLAMFYAYFSRKQLADDLKESERERAEAISRTDFAEEFASVALKKSVEADSNSTTALLKAEEAQRLFEITERKRIAAEQAVAEAERQKMLAQMKSDSAAGASLKAALTAEAALEDKTRAQQLRMISLAKSMTIRSLQMNEQKDLQSLLAYQAYLFNKKNFGQENDADIFSGLYNVAKLKGNVNYKTFQGHSGEIKSVAFVPGKKEFFTSGADGKVLKWNLDNTKSSLQVVYSGTEITEVLSVSPDADWLACGGQNAAIRMIPINGKGIEFELKGHSGKIESLIFSIDSKYLYSSSADGNVRKWDLSSRNSIIVSPAAILITRIDLSADGRRLAGTGSKGNAVVWDPERNIDVFTIESSARHIKTVRFKPGGNILAVGYTDGYMEIWDIDKKEKLSGIQAHTSEINDIRFNSKLSQMATAGSDGKLNLWDTRDLTALPVSFGDNEGFVMTAGFSPDGQMIISGTFEGSPNLVGRPTSADLMARNFCASVERNFTMEEWISYIGKDIEYEETCPGADTRIRIREINRK